MSSKYYSVQIDKKAALEGFAAEQKRRELQDELAGKILPVLQKFDGKKITKRIKTAIEVALPDWVVSMDHRELWSTSSIHLWKSWRSDGYSPDLDYQHGFTFYLEREEGTDNLSFEKTVSRYPYTIDERQKGYEKSLEALAYDQAAQEEFGRLVDQWNKCAKELETIKSEARESNTPYQYLFDWRE